MFEASDSSKTDDWFRARMPRLVQSAGLPVHTGRQVDSDHQHMMTKVSEARRSLALSWLELNVSG